jgi:flavin-dependent dehydrogenase
LGLIEQLKRSAFPKKYSVQFVSETGKESAPFYFDDHRQHESAQTWQVIRSDFDQMLLDNAESKGAVARTNARVTQVVFDGDKAIGVRAQCSNATGKSATEKDAAEKDATAKQVHEIASKVVVDATGQSAFLANRLGLKQPDGRLVKGAVWSYFRGAHRDSGKAEGATLILQTEGKKSWFWYIPLPDDTVSVGCTGGMGYLFGKDHGTPADVFAKELARCPGMQRRLAHATRASDFFTTKDFSYRASQAAGPGWVLVGDAFGFIDPVYSSGVFLALKSGEFAADAIRDAFQSTDFSAAQLGCWQEEYVAGLELFRKLVYAFYMPDFSFGTFLKANPRFRGHLVDMLIGDVFRPEVGEMFEVLGEMLPPADLPPET